MKRLLLLSFFLSSALILGAIIGCESSGKSTDTADNDTDTTQFLLADDLFGDNLFSSVFQALDLSIALLDSIPGAGTSGKDWLGGLSSEGAADVIVNAISEYSYANGWHIFAFEATQTDAATQITVILTGIDSLQLLDGQAPVQYPLSYVTIDTIKARAHLNWTTDPVGSTGSFNHAFSIGIDRTEIDTVYTINGSASDSLHGAYADTVSECTMDLTMAQSVFGLQIDANCGECPRAGAVIISATVDLACTGGSDNPDSLGSSLQLEGAWNVTVVVNDNNTVTITYSDGTTNWVITEPCDGGVATSSRWWCNH
ncbi:MAG: hypothetical protein OEW00_07595 [candidate division Zixibacteria bacterium]|nr:hypothetical protein [candidate division Zixibacteria bacterium]